MKRTLLYLVVIFTFTSLILAGCKSTSGQGTVTDQEYRELGLEISNKAFEQLKGNLMGAINNYGIIGAIDYCKVNALPIVDSVAQGYEISIKRVSTRNRNPKNVPDEIEAELIASFSSDMHDPSIIDTLVTLSDGSKLYARPILLQEPCLKCHGSIGSDIDLNDYDYIKKAYPEDKAVGYSIGDFRGMWVINF